MKHLGTRLLSLLILCTVLCGLLLSPVQAAQTPAPSGAQLRTTGQASGIDKDVLQSGRLEKKGSRLRYRRSNGKYLTNKWRTVKGKKYYFGGQTYAVTGLQKIGKKYYIFNGTGVLQKGWVKSKSHWYYASPRSGRLRSGWQKIDGKTYYLSPSSLYRLTGFQTIKDKRYYFNASGVMQTKDQMINGTYVRFRSDGSIISQNSGSKGQQVAKFAVRFVGKPYKWGGSSLTRGADCSGFVMAVYAHFGVSLPHYDAAIRARGRKVASLSQALPGDVICYRGHVAIYLGKNRIVHAANSRQGICISNNAAYTRILSIRRFL